MGIENPENNIVPSSVFEERRVQKQAKHKADKEAQLEADFAKLQKLLAEYRKRKDTKEIAPEENHTPLKLDPSNYETSITKDQERMWSVVHRLEQAQERDERLEADAQELCADLEQTIETFISWGETVELKEFQKIREALLVQLREYIERFTEV